MYLFIIIYSCIWTNQKTSGRLSFAEIRPEWRRLAVMHKTQTQHINTNTTYHKHSGGGVMIWAWTRGNESTVNSSIYQNILESNMRSSVWQLKLDWNCIKWQWPQAQQQIYNRMVKETNTEGVTEIQTSSTTLNECLNFNGLTYHCKVRSVKLLHVKVLLQSLNPEVHLVFPHTASPFWLSLSYINTMSCRYWPQAVF